MVNSPGVVPAPAPEVVGSRPITLTIDPKVLLSSRDALVPGLNMDTRVAIATCRDKTIVVSETDSSIKIVDQNGVVDPDFKGDLRLNMNWRDPGIVEVISRRVESCRGLRVGAVSGVAGITTRDGSWNESTGHNNRGELTIVPFILSKELHELFLGFFKKAEVLLQSHRRQTLEFANNPTVSVDMATDGGFRVIVSEDQKYVFVVSENSDFFVGFKTCDETGAPLPPRNWIRVSSVEVSRTTPRDIIKEVNGLGIGMDQSLALGNDIFAKVYGDRIVFSKKLNAQRAGAPPVNNPVRTESMSGVGENICIDPSDRSSVYFCRGTNVSTFTVMDVKDPDPSQWKTTEVNLPQPYEKVERLKFDSTGRFLMFDVIENGNRSAVFADKYTMQEVYRMKGYSVRFFHLDSGGRFSMIDPKSGKLVVYPTNLRDVVTKLDGLRVKAGNFPVVAGLAAGQKPAAVIDERRRREILDPLRRQFINAVLPRLKLAATIDDIESIQSSVDQFEQGLSGIPGQHFTPEETGYIFDLIRNAITGSADKILQGVVTSVRGRFAGVTVGVMGDVGEEVRQLQRFKKVITPRNFVVVDSVQKEFQSQVQDFFTHQGKGYIAQVQAFVGRARRELESMVSKQEFDDWYAHSRPGLIKRFGELEGLIPIEAGDAHQAVIAARGELQKLSEEYSHMFEARYAEIRGRAVSQIAHSVAAIKFEIGNLEKVVGDTSFVSRDEADAYIEASQTYKMIQQDIYTLESKGNADTARELTQALKQEKIRVLNLIDRRKNARIDPTTGRQMESFGGFEFPIWEAVPEKKESPKAEVVFMPDNSSSAANELERHGDVGVEFTTKKGSHTMVRLWQILAGREEERRRFGEVAVRGEGVRSYMSRKEFLELMKLYRRWGTDVNPGPLRQEFEAKRDALIDHYKTRRGVTQPPKSPMDNDKTPTGEGAQPPKSTIDNDLKFGRAVDEPAWQKRYRELLDEYGKFYVDNKISSLRQVESVVQCGWPENGNGKVGMVPEISPTWTFDEQTESYLREMAVTLKMQLDTKQGALNLVGHAGTGKDVVVDMFCARTKRPKFTFDCTRWTDETALGEDIVLEDGSTVKIPSSIVVGMQTPGSVIYLNEFNAMPHNAQIFLHSIFDGKRTMSLKTRPNVKIKAAEGVLFVMSMNYGYPGTFHPQMATDSRLHPLQIDYPPLMRAVPGETPAFSSSEPLRIARNVDSLEDDTYETDLGRNIFVKKWDQHVNRIESGQQIGAVEAFDMDVIFYLTAYAAKLREEFKKNFTPSGEGVQKKGGKSPGRNVLPVFSPFTMRELVKCAWFLSNQVPTSAKQASAIQDSAQVKAVLDLLALPATVAAVPQISPKDLAQFLVYKYFLSHIYDDEDKDKIFKAMRSEQSWNVSKRS